MPPSLSAAALAVGTWALVACAADSAAGAGLPIHLRLTQPSMDGDAIARRVSEVAGVPARYVAPTSAEWHALVLECPDNDSCAHALQRLRDASDSFAAVDRNERRRVHAP